MQALINEQQSLSSFIAEQAVPIDIAVSFWGKGAVKALDLAREDRDVRVLLNFSAGATNPAEVEELLSLKNVQTKHLERLHAKTYICGDTVIVGSANASANGLGLEGAESSHWHELAMTSKEPATVFKAKGWFEDLWTLGSSITPEHMKAEKAAWKRRQRARPSHQKQSGSILEAAIAHPAAFKNRGLYVVVSTLDWDEDGYDDAEKYKSEFTKRAYGWQDWKNMPLDSHLIAFTDEEGEFNFDGRGIYLTPNKLHRYGSLYLVQPTTLPDRMNRGDLAAWSELLSRARERNQKTWAHDCFCEDLGVFVEEYGD